MLKETSCRSESCKTFQDPSLPTCRTSTRSRLSRLLTRTQNESMIWGDMPFREHCFEERPAEFCAQSVGLALPHQHAGVKELTHISPRNSVRVKMLAELKTVPCQKVVGLSLSDVQTGGSKQGATTFERRLR